MDNRDSNHPQSAEPLPGPGSPSSTPDSPPRPVRPNRNFPIYIVETPDGPTMMDSVRLAEYEASLQAAKNARIEAENAVRAAREAELAAGRPPSSSPAPFSAEPAAELVPATLASRHSSVARASTPSSYRPPDFARHSRRCSICSHPDRDAIEGDFIRWRSPQLIAEDYNLSDRSSIYRHAHATGLLAWRKQELGRVLEGILESAEGIPLDSADVIIRAARLYSRLDERGNYSEPSRTNYVFSGPIGALHPLESALPANSGHAGRPGAQGDPTSEGNACPPDLAEANRNIAQFKNSVNSMNPEEKANS